MRRPRAGLVDLCFLCGEPITTGRSKEHFLSRAFYEGGRLPNEPGLCLSAHIACNASTSQDEQWLATAMSLSNPMGGRIEEPYDRAIRTLNKPEALKLKEQFISRLYEVPGGAGFTVGGDRTTWVLAKIVKGLCWRECRTFLGPQTEWTVRVADYADAIERSAKWSIEVPSTGVISQRGTVLIAKGDVTNDGVFLWHLIVQGQHPYLVATLPRAKLHAGAMVLEHDFMKLAWPKPESSRAGVE